jgi:hypothetical protein
VTESNKKFKNQDLPQEIDRLVWRRSFVPTFMMNIARQDNPFEHNVKAGCEAMQKIWDTIFDETPYTIIQSSPVYQLVRFFFFNSLLVCEGIHLQTMQRVSDSWRSTMGSTAITVVLAFCNAKFKDSDEDRQEFATFYLEHLRFLYQKSDDDDISVSFLFQVVNFLC